MPLFPLLAGGQKRRVRPLVREALVPILITFIATPCASRGSGPYVLVIQPPPPPPPAGSAVAYNTLPHPCLHRLLFKGYLPVVGFLLFRVDISSLQGKGVVTGAVPRLGCKPIYPFHP